MKKTGAELARFALEQVGVTHTFGIPGVHNTELYDQLNLSRQITPIQVTHEAGAAFMADAVSRVSDSIGTIVVVPAAGLTHAASGIGEAFLDGIPMLVICGGTRNDLEFEFQLHQMDQHQFMKGLTKETFLVKSHQDVIPMLYEAYGIATSGEPGPVFVEIPVNIQLMAGEVSDMPAYHPLEKGNVKADLSDALNEAAELIRSAKRPCIFAGWGSRDAAPELTTLAERLTAPVATTLQGLSVFPADHPLHVGMGIGPSTVPAAQKAFEDCDCLIAIGTRFSEIPTGSFGAKVPENLIHIDINPDALGANYPAKVGIAGDAQAVLQGLLETLGNDTGTRDRAKAALEELISTSKSAYREEWYGHDSKGRVNPARFFDGLDRSLGSDAIIVVDDGNHTFLAAELLPVHRVKGFICPSDFNCMGYAAPAAIGAKLASPSSDVVAVIGDGAFTMTCMEILTASRNKLGIVYYVFNDGELSQIAQAQDLPYNQKTCTVMGELNVAAIAAATGAEYLEILSNKNAEGVAKDALSVARGGKPVIVNVLIDYSKKTAFTKGTVQTNFKRFPVGTKVRILGRSLYRRLVP
ncbi:thiamine pyrophosphate-binding protein [Sneathiella limimaris]|uniref:thiamine pyrophosphate-binding protein n=1 Tax=Sneathiella limimaris TaxID=1964213 RepID=UPI00146C1A27|nr:thiamine pyrophosphate-binding protein [Sneathiella limimaris]